MSRDRFPILTFKMGMPGMIRPNDYGLRGVGELVPGDVNDGVCHF